MAYKLLMVVDYLILACMAIFGVALYFQFGPLGKIFHTTSYVRIIGLILVALAIFFSLVLWVNYKKLIES